MKFKSAKTLALVTFFIAKISFADSDVITESMTFHYDKYPESVYSNQVAVINWNSEEGIARLERTKFKGDFYRLAHHFKPQADPVVCGQAAATMILSAIYELNHQPFPIVEEWPIAINDKKHALQYRMLNENNFHNEATDKVLHRKAISMKITKTDGSFGGGIDIDELQKMLRIHGAKSKLVTVDKYSDKKLAGFRELVKEVVNSPKEFLLLNYDHSYKGLMGGHFSPLAAYDEKSDSILILDVAAHRNPWIWINLSDLYHAMNTKNYSQTSYRGYSIVSTKLHR